MSERFEPRDSHLERLPVSAAPASGTAQESVEDILRPLVEATVRTWEAPGPEPIGGTLFTEAPDPRFDALRCPPRVYCHEEGIHADSGAIIRAMRAFQSQTLVMLSYDESMRQYVCGFMGWHGHGDTQEEGLARALVAAWREERKDSVPAP